MPKHNFIKLLKRHRKKEHNKMLLVFGAIAVVLIVAVLFFSSPSLKLIGKFTGQQPCMNSDGDGFFAEENCGTRQDCNDSDSRAYPGAREACNDRIDNDCDGKIDEYCGTK